MSAPNVRGKLTREAACLCVLAMSKATRLRCAYERDGAAGTDVMVAVVQYSDTCPSRCCRAGKTPGAVLSPRMPESVTQRHLFQ